MLTIATSIPPMLNRRASAADGITTDIRDEAINSWRNIGADIYSMNTSAELERNPDLRLFIEARDISILSVPSTSHQPGHLPNLRSSLQSICKHDCPGLIAIMNSDIILDFSNHDLDIIHKADETSFFVAHRCDISELEKRYTPVSDRSLGAGFKPCRNGLDLFIAHRNLLLKSLRFLSPDLTLGLPWWDLALPVALLAAGGSMQHLDYRKVLHIEHDQRSWGTASFNRMGYSAVHHLRRSLTEHNPSSTAMLWLSATEWVKAKHSRPIQKLARLKLRAGRYRRGIWEEPLSNWLSETAELTQSLIGHGIPKHYW